MSYAQPSDLLLRYDAIRLGQLVRDDGTQASSGQLLSDPVLQACLDDFAGEIDSACLFGGRYDPNDLTLVIFNGAYPAGKSGAAKLIRLNCDGAYGYLMMRRGFTEQEAASLAPGFKWALSVCEQLRWGARVFNSLVLKNSPPPTPNPSTILVDVLPQIPVGSEITHVHPRHPDSKCLIRVFGMVHHRRFP